MEIWRFLLEHKYFFRQQVTASAVCSTLPHKHSLLADFKWPFSVNSGGFKVGGPEARLKGALWWRHYTQPTVIKHFCSSPRYSHRRIRSWYYGMTEIAERENAKGCSWYTTLKTLKDGATRLATHKSWAIASWHRFNCFIFTPHSSAFTINTLQSLPLWKFDTFPFGKMLGSW